MRKTLGTWLLAVGVGTMAMLPAGCKRHAAPAPTPAAAAPRPAPAPRFEPFSSDVGAAKDTSSQPPIRRRRTENLPEMAPAPANQDTEAQVEAEQRERDAGLLRQQEAASQRQQQELNQTVQQSQKAQEQEEAEPRIEDAPGPAPTQRIQDAPGPPPAPRIQDAPGPSQMLPPVQPQPAPPEV
jgi:DNA polymerase III gamma/tau subunit